MAPEFNPFKYNSFPVKAARQSWLLSGAAAADYPRCPAGRAESAAADLTFQSVMDSTVSTRAVVESCIAICRITAASWWCSILTGGGSPGPVSPCALCGGEYAAAPAPRAYTTTVVTNATAHTLQTVARTTLARNGKSIVILTPAWPADMYSLSHVAVPFP